MTDFDAVGRYEVTQFDSSARIPEDWFPFAVTQPNAQTDIKIWCRKFIYADDELGDDWLPDA